MHIRLEAISILFGITIIAALFVRQVAPLAYSPAIVDALSSVPRKSTEGLNLHDGRIIRQTFIASAKKITHIAIGVSNFREADRQAVIRVRLLDSANQEQWRGFARLGDFRPDDVTNLPASMSLITGQSYSVDISSQGVPAGQDVTIWHEQESGKFTDGQATVNDKLIPGNIRLQIIRRALL